MIRFDPKSGHFWLQDIDAAIEPRMSYGDFLDHPAAKRMPEIISRRASNFHEHQLPVGEFEHCRVTGTASFTNDELEALWLQVFSDASEVEIFRYERGDPRLLELQERWLRQVVGVESREYPWGLVWNRFNINAGFHDIAILFSRAEPATSDEGGDAEGDQA